MRTIWKFSLAGVEQQTIEAPNGAEALCVQLQNGEPFLWAAVSPENSTIQYQVWMRGTGHNCDNIEGKYLGTFQLNNGLLVFHVYTNMEG